MIIDTQSDTLHFALDYAQRGWPVFPCNPMPGKNINKTPLVPGGLNSATRDPEQIKAWWTRWPNAMIGVPMGAVSGVVAIDPDAPKEDKDADGRRAWALLVAQHGATYTHTHLTPGGGKHILFRYDPERPLTNSPGGLQGTGIDVRGNGGYIVVPPSARADGKKYEVADPLDFFSFAPIPEWLIEIIKSPAKPSISQRATEQMRRTVNGSDGYTESFFTRTNTEALRNLSAWVPSVFPRAEFQSGTGAWRISSDDLGRDLEEDLSIHPKGITDWGTHDIGDPRGGKRTPIDLLVESGQSHRADDAALWLCNKIGVDPKNLGWDDGGVENIRLFAEAKQERSTDPEVQPVDLWSELATPSLPEDCLPKVIEDLAKHQAKLMGVDPGGMAMAALTVCAAAIPDSIHVQVKKHDDSWTEAARLWVGLVGLPSTKKTPLASMATAPLAKIDGELYRKYAEAKEEHDALSVKEKKGAKKPKQHRVMLMDVTIEHVQEVMRDSPDGILCFQDELAGWFGSMDKYNAAAGASANRAFWLQAYNGKPYTWGRIGRGTGYIPNLSTCVLGGIQPSVIQKVAGDGVDDGLLQRLCPIVLKPGTVGDDVPPHHSVDAYKQTIERLHELRPPMTTNTLVPMEVPLQFSDPAQKLRRDLEHKHQELTRLEYISPMLASHLGKYNGIYARLCVIFHCIECVSSERTDRPWQAHEKLGLFIQPETAERAAKFLHGYLLKHAVAFYCGVLDMGDHHRRITAVAGYILAHKLDRVTNRDIQRGVKTLRDLGRRETELIFEHLEAFGWVTRHAAPRPADPPHWIVNPSVHSLFSDRADKERQWRAETVEMLADLKVG